MLKCVELVFFQSVRTKSPFGIIIKCCMATSNNQMSRHTFEQHKITVTLRLHSLAQKMSVDKNKQSDTSNSGN